MDMHAESSFQRVLDWEMWSKTEIWGSEGDSNELSQSLMQEDILCAQKPGLYLYYE